MKTFFTGNRDSQLLIIQSNADVFLLIPTVSAAHTAKIESRAGISSRLLPRFFITTINYKKTVHQHNQKNYDI